MIYGVYAVKDELINKYLQPIYAESDPAATRDFKYKINNIEQWKQNASDYSLYRLGTFDDESGIYESTIEKVQGGRSVVDG